MAADSGTGQAGTGRGTGRMERGISDFRDWIGRSETRVEPIAAFPANALEATLDRDPALAPGDALPPLYHWLHFLSLHRMDHTNYDGHARLGDFLPPVPLPRRMWAGGRLEFLAPLRIGAVLRRRSTVLDVAQKQGRSGALVFVTVEHRIEDGATLCLREQHDIVYREAPRADAASPPPRPAPEGGAFARSIRPDPVLLFRYSALTFNGHRIHYDLPFCRAEGYPGLVVHGPLLATLLTDLIRRERPQARLAAFAFRALAPVFDTEGFSVHGAAAGGDAMRLWVRRHDGALAMDAEARLA